MSVMGSWDDDSPKSSELRIHLSLQGKFLPTRLAAQGSILKTVPYSPPLGMSPSSAVP